MALGNGSCISIIFHSNLPFCRIIRGKGGIKIGCYNASVTKPLCGNGIVTYSPDLNYTAEFELTGCDGRRIEGVPVSWRELSESAADNEITSCRNQCQCSIPIGIIQRRIGNPLVLEIWTSIVPIHKLVRLGIILNVKPPEHGVYTKRSKVSAQTSVSGTKTIGPRTKPRTAKTYSIRKPRKRPSRARTFEDLVLEHLSSSAMTSQGQEKTNRSDRISFSRIPSRSFGKSRHRNVKVTSRKPGTQNQKHKSKKEKISTKLIAGAATEMSVWGTVKIMNTTSYDPNMTDTSPTVAESKDITRNHSGRIKMPTAIVNASRGINVPVVKTHNNSKAIGSLSVHRKVKPLSLNITLTKHGTWTKGGKSKLNIHRKMEIRINSNISDSNTALDSILSSTSQKRKPSLVNKYRGYVRTSASSKNDTRVRKQKHTKDQVMYNCVEFFCGKQGKKGRCPKILVLQCLHLSSGERRQLMLGDIREEVQQLIDMFNVSKSDLKEIEKSAKASAHQLMIQNGNANTFSKKIGIATAEILRKLYNASYLASRAAITERFGWTREDARTGSIRVFEEWSNWSHCSASCGTGITTRSRVCPHKTAECLTKPSHVSRVCTTSACHKVHPQQPMPWSSWSACSVTCGLGQEKRSRTCDGGSGRKAKTKITLNRDRCKEPITMARLCIMSTCNADSNTWRKTVLLGYDTVLSCGLSRPWSSPQTYWITPGGNKVSRTTHLPRIYMVSDTLVIHGAQKSDEGVYHCIVDQLQPSQIVTTDTRIEVLTCSSSPCENGGTCKEQRYSFHRQLKQVTCACRKGYGGRHCQDHVSHSDFRLYVLVACLIGLLFSSLLGFLVYCCAYRKAEQDKPKLSKKKEVKNKPGKEPQMFEHLVEEADVSTNLDSSIIHSDDSWIQISEKDYHDFQEQTASNLHGPVSRSLPVLNALSFKTTSMSSHPMLQRKSVSNTENRTRDNYGDMQPESRTHVFPDQPDGNAYEVPTSPEIKSKILLIKPNRKAKSSPDLKAKKTVSFQVEGVRDNAKDHMDEKIKSMANGSAHQASFTYRGGQQASTTRSPYQMSSTASSVRKLSSTSPAKQISTNSSVCKMSSDPNEDKDFLDMSDAHQSEKELVIVTSDSIIGLHGEKTNRDLEDGLEIVHRRTFSPHEQSHDSKLEENVKQSEEDMKYTPVYYTYQPSADKDDLYVDMCEFVHRNTFFPEEDVQQAPSEQLYVNLMDKSAAYSDYQIPINIQTKQYSHPETNMSQATSQEDCGLKTTNVENDEDDVIFKSSNPEDLSLDHEANSSNHSYTEDQNTLDQIVSDSERLDSSTSLDNVRTADNQEMNSFKFIGKLISSTSFEGDDECYESDQSSTLCPMPDLDGSEFIDDGSWDATLKDCFSNKIDDSAEVLDSLVRSFEKPRSFDTSTELDTVSKLPNDTDGMTSSFDVSLGDLLDGIDNDRLFGQITSDNDNDPDSCLSSCSDIGHRDTEAGKSPSNGRSKTEISQHAQSSSTFDNSEIQQQPKTFSPSSPRTRMCRGHYEMVYGPASYPSPIFQLDSESSSDVQGMTTEVENLPLQAYPTEHHYSSKSNSDFP
ncbi:uncharacterized protein LOC110455326 isoform X2 [Mizuhopecten yessoensis]|uniref:Brain-specific angiogenesis inhibitor 3 n=1 Tax=Mizuhopecten yessoensis TaxID=6573 RepID=A0A210QD64_MIZYE|nr:uncharacterized protein LOC110455326 isoform X2 [Mizuhopecten yessoensis]OWF46687.1 Brain-specific angiogenesis inhibitor 3 [Mizuhopecten yessoensis]